MNKACFFDRDGVLIEEMHYLSDPENVRLCDGAADAIRMMRTAGYKIVVVSNQSGVARGYFSEDDLARVEQRVQELLRAQDAAPDRTYYCVHHPKGERAEYRGDCDCRKPKPGMLLRAATELGLDLRQSLLIGDKRSDLEAGFHAGCRAAALVRTGHGADQNIFDLPAAIDAPDVRSAAERLLVL